MSADRPTRCPVLILALAAAIALPIAGCDSSGSSQSVQVSPETQKKTEEMLTNYQKKMQDQHKAKAATKKPR